MHAFLIVGSGQEVRSQEAEKLASSRGVGEASDIRYRMSRPKDDRPLAEDVGKSITIAEVRELQHWVTLLSHRPRAAIISEAQRLTRPAQHALLKILEEPQSQETRNLAKGRAGKKQETMTIILTADSEESLLRTIRSRCRIIRLRRVPASTSQPSRLGILNLEGFSPAQRILKLYEILSELTGKKITPHQGAIQRVDALEFVEQIILELHQQINSEFRIAPSLKAMAACDPNSELLARTLLEASLAHRQLNSNLNPALVLGQFVLDMVASN